MRFADLANAAGLLTLLRLAIGALVSVSPTPALGWLYALAILTDVLDGPVARRRGHASAAGATLDAWADKVLHVNLAWTLVNRDLMPAAFMLAWFTRELIQVLLIPVLVHRWRTLQGRPRTSPWGRATAIALFVAASGVLLGVDASWPTLLTGCLGTVAGLDYARVHLAPLFLAPAAPLAPTLCPPEVSRC